MAATPPPILAEPATDNRRLVLIAVAMPALLAVPIGISVGMSWVDLPWSNVEPAKAAPEWVNLPQVRATTVDGTVVKARVALDVPGAVAKNTIQRNTQQVGLLLEVSIAQQTREQIGSPKGIARLSDDMRDRLNACLGGDDDEAAHRPAGEQHARAPRLRRP